MSLAGVDEALRWKHLDSASVFSPLLTFGSVEWASFKFPSCTLSLSRSLGCISLISAEFIFNCPFVTSCWTCEMMTIDYWSETSRTRESPWWLLFRWAHCSFPTTVDPHPPTRPTLTTVLLMMVLIFVAEGQTKLSSDDLWPPLFTCPHLFLCSYDK